MPVILKDFELGDTCDECEHKICRDYRHPVFGCIDFVACLYSDEVFMTDRDAKKMRAPSCPFREVRYLSKEEMGVEE